MKNLKTMKKKHLYLLAGICLAIGFGFGLAFDGLFTKSYANNEKNDLSLPSAPAFEVMESGSARSADYEIVNIYGRKYIVFSSGGDIEVLNY